MHADLSINRKLTRYIAVLITIIVTLATASIVGLHIIDEESESLERQTLVSTQALGELDAYVSKFRVTEEYRAFASDTDARSAVEMIAVDQRRKVDALEARYRALQADHDGKLDLAAFNTAWNAYMAAHDDWVSRDNAGNINDAARYRSTLHNLYAVVDDAVDAVIVENTLRGDMMANAVDRLVHTTTLFLLALSVAGLIVASLLVVRVRRDITEPLSAITKALGALANGNREVLVPSPNRHDEIGVMADAFNVFRANTFALEQAHQAAHLAQEHAQALARHDPLTGLPNRRVFEAEIERAVSTALMGQELCSLLLIDLDRFKPINDQLGHPAGDTVLCTVAGRLKSLAGGGVTAARLGGDEFALILAGPAEGHAGRLAELLDAILVAMHAPIDLGGNTVSIGATIGVALCPTDGMDRETLLRAADLALYRAKREGRGRVCFFEPGLETELQEKTRLEADLRAAVAEGAFVPQYRALANLRDGTTHGFELRPYWNNPMPSEVYLALAGQLGILSDLMWPLMRQACRDARSWPGETVLVVNLAPVQLRDPALPTQILHVLAQENFLPSRLEMQIPELTLIAEMEPVEAILLAFQSAGIRISIGDFGTGLSRMCRFDNVRFETVKIGDAFARSLSGGGRSDGLVGSVLALARNLGRAAAADGIETTETSSRLSSLGCDLGQGLLFGRALLGSEVGLPVAANIG